MVFQPRCYSSLSDHEVMVHSPPSEASMTLLTTSNYGQDGTSFLNLKGGEKSANLELLKKNGCLRQAYIDLRDMKLDNTIESRSHASASDRKKIHTCYVCMCKFASLEHLEIHRYVHTDSEESQAEEEYDWHDKYITRISDSQIICKTKSSLNDLNDDKSKDTTDTTEKKEETVEIGKNINEDYSALPVEIASYKCNTCNSCFNDPSLIKLHKVDCKLSCLTCNKNFKTKWNMLIHIIDHLYNCIDKEENYTCKLCKVKLTSSLQYKKHIWTHSKNAIEKLVDAEKKHEQKKKEADNNPDECHLRLDVSKTKQDLEAQTKKIVEESSTDISRKLQRPSTAHIKKITGKSLSENNIVDNEISRRRSAIQNKKKDGQSGHLSFSSNYKLPPENTTNVNFKPTVLKQSLTQQETSDSNKQFSGNTNLPSSSKLVPSCTVTSNNSTTVSNFVDDKHSIVLENRCNLNNSKSTVKTATSPQKNHSPKYHRSNQFFNHTNNSPSQEQASSCYTQNYSQYSPTSSHYSDYSTTQSNSFLNQSTSSPTIATSCASTNIVANNPFDDTFEQSDNNSMFEDQDFISLNQFEELCKSKGKKPCIDENLLTKEKECTGTERYALLAASTENTVEPVIPNVEVPSSPPSQDRNDLPRDNKKLNTFTICVNCQKVIATQADFMRHSLLRMTCTLCPAEYCDISQIKNHYYSQHKLLYCIACGFLAHNEHEFNMHKSRCINRFYPTD